MNLDTTTKILQVILGEAKTTNDCDVTASYADSTIGGFVLGDKEEKSNGTSAVTVVAAPGNAGTQRQVKEVRVYNNDTVAHLITLRLFDGSASWIVQQQTKGPGELFLYTPEGGSALVPGPALVVKDDTGDTVTSIGSLQFNGVKVSGVSPNAITNMTTISGAPGSGVTAGGGIRLNGGIGGSPAAGGGVLGYGGAGGPGTASTGGSVHFKAGNGGTTATNGAGGSAQLIAGSSFGVAQGGYAGCNAGPSNGSGDGGLGRLLAGVAYGTGAGGNILIESGNALTSNAGAIFLTAGSSYGTGAGGDVQVSPGTGTLPGQFKVANDPSLIVASLSWAAGEQLNNRTIHTATRAEIVTAVIGRPDVINGTAATLVIVKAASGTAPSGGTVLTSTSMDLTASANTNQTLTLSVTLSDITLAPGDSLCMVTTGTLLASVGCITVWATPQ